MLAAIVLVGLLLCGSVVVLRARSRIFSLPENSPAVCRNRAPAGVATVALLGDSLTHGTMSHNYVALLEERFRGRPFRFVNAGVNSDLAYNLHERMDGIIACRPDFAIVLVGTNDVNALVSEEKLQSYIKEQRLPMRPDAIFFRRQLNAVVRRLQTETAAKIALCSLPPIGEDLNSKPNQNVIAYSQIIAKVAETARVSYLPLRETLWKELATRPSGRTPRDCSSGKYPITGAAVRHHLLGQSWDSIGERHGFHVLTDCLHLNSRGAGIVADLVAGFIENASTR